MQKCRVSVWLCYDKVYIYKISRYGYTFKMTNTKINWIRINLITIMNDSCNESQHKPFSSLPFIS